MLTFLFSFFFCFCSCCCKAKEIKALQAREGRLRAKLLSDGPVDDLSSGEDGKQAKYHPGQKKKKEPSRHLQREEPCSIM